MSIPAGKLRHRVVIRQPFANPANPTRDALGQPTPDWTKAFATVSAGIEPLSSREIFAAQTVRAQVSHRITIRYLPGISATMRIEYTDPGTNTLRIFAIDGTPTSPDEKREYMELLALERST